MQKPQGEFFAPTKVPRASGRSASVRLINLAAGCLAAVLTFFCGLTGAQNATTPAPRPEFLRIAVPEAKAPIQVRRISVQAEIAGLVVATRLELELFNPNARVLEAQLEFPLLEGKSVTGFALDIDGEMRPAVTVPKAKGQQVFEDVTRARVDPALLESTGGNNYKLRVYPLPAKGSRRVVLEISESVRAASKPAWRLPLQFGGVVDNLDVEISVAGVAGKTLKTMTAQIGAAKLPVKEAKDGRSASIAYAKAGFRSGGELRVTLPRATVNIATALQSFNGETYFYADVAAPSGNAPRARPDRVAIVWDASSSGERRDHAREFATLDAYFKSLRNLEVSLTAVRDVADATETFSVTDGQWSELRKRLESITYDGATNLGEMKVPASAQLALLFTDGLGNYGNDPLPKPDVPLYALSASAGTDGAGMRQLAEASGGGYIDLLAVTAADASSLIATERTRLAGVSATGAKELEFASVYPEGGRLAIAGILTDPEAEVTLNVAAVGGSAQKLVVKISGSPDSKRAGVAVYQWASMRLARLDADAERNKASILRLGTTYRMVTRQTSLIVLDSVQDYARYEIEPPASMRAQYLAALGDRREGQARLKARQIDRIAEKFEQKQSWWAKDFPKDKIEPEPPRHGSGAPAPVAAMAMAPPPSPAPAPALAPAARSESAAPRVNADAIQLRKWVPDEPYAKRLRDAESKDLYAIYLDERPPYLSSSAFYLDVADILFERKQPTLASRVLSNLAEMNLENRHLLRILGYRLMLAGQADRALPVLRKVLALSPNEPQSYRDLGLALAKAGQAQEAVDKLYEVVSTPWNGRFPGVELVALAELNAIVAVHPRVDASKIDPRLQRNLPLDLRAVMTWDADNSDIDLWVIDPNGEKAYYGNRLTRQGGRMSEDFTGGYGPEEFSLKSAMPGTYVVMAQFFGHRQQIIAPATTLMLKLTTGFGTADQHDEDVVLRLTGTGRSVVIGTFKIDKPGEAIKVSTPERKQ